MNALRHLPPGNLLQLQRNQQMLPVHGTILVNHVSLLIATFPRTIESVSHGYILHNDNLNPLHQSQQVVGRPLKSQVLIPRHI